MYNNNDKLIIEALLNANDVVTRQFFYKKCRPLLLSIIRRVFDYPVDYDECVNELYLYLMENDGYRLRQFKGESTIYQWLKTVALRFFISRKSRMIENKTHEPPFMHETEVLEISTARMDLRVLLKQMENERYVKVIEELNLNGRKPEDVAKEMNITIDNLYNVKRRAIIALTKIALKDKDKEKYNG